MAFTCGVIALCTIYSEEGLAAKSCVTHAVQDATDYEV